VGGGRGRERRAGENEDKPEDRPTHVRTLHLQRGDGSEPNSGTYSITTGTKFVPLRKNKIPFIRNDESPIPKHPETRNSCSAKSKDKTQKKKNFGLFHLINKCLCRKSGVNFQKSPTANMDNSEFDKPSRD